MAKGTPKKRQRPSRDPNVAAFRAVSQLTDKADRNAGRESLKGWIITQKLVGEPAIPAAPIPLTELPDSVRGAFAGIPGRELTISYEGTRYRFFVVVDDHDTEYLIALPEPS